MVLELLLAGLLALQDYIALHVLTCLVPAFLLAGGLVTFINRQAILSLFGAKAGKPKAFSLAGVSSFALAACSCTVIPVASGLYFSGAGIGVAFIILWVAPAANVLALVYTGAILGGEMVLARVAAALLVAFAVGYVMSTVFKGKTGAVPHWPPTASPESGKIIETRYLVLFLLILLSLLLPNYLIREGPYLDKVLLWSALTLVMVAYAWRMLSWDSITEWLRETWWFVRIITPLLLGGVFLVGVIGAVLPEQWIQSWLGGNGLLACFLATFIGAVSYFATMTEAPFVDMLMGVGMGKGPALALLLAGPGLSLPNWLAIARVFGIRPALVYVPTIIVLATLAGWVFGNLA
jgi:hypothetical protein